MGTHKQLEVWKNSIELAREVYKQTIGFPKNELYGLTNQIRRASVSVPSNISEGSARMRPREFHQFLRISFGSLSELETLLIITIELDYLNNEDCAVLQKQIKIITAQLIGLIHAIEKKIENHPPY
jgi:four helix bundle protein